MKLGWVLPLLMLVVGFGLGRLTIEERERADRAPRPVTHEPPVERPVVRTTTVAEHPTETGAPTNAESCMIPQPSQLPHVAIRLPVNWNGERFVHWYRSHAATYEFTPRTPEQLRSFGAQVISKLGRIPRRELLDALLDAFVPLHAARHDAEAALREGKIARHEFDARLAPARRLFSYKLYRTLAFSDYLFVTREWADDKNPYRPFRHDQPPTGRRPQSGDPYAIRFGSLEVFVAWYQAYRHELELPERDHDFLNLFYGDIVKPLGRAPQPRLMLEVQKLYGAYRQHGGDKAVRELFRGLRPLLDPIDYDRIRWSANWSSMLQDMGLLR